VKQGDETHHHWSTADDRKNVVDYYDELRGLFALIGEDEVHAHQEELLAVENVEHQSDDLHGEDGEERKDG
jgi:hypothetical protein